MSGMRLLSIIFATINAIVWNVLIYYCIETYRGHEHFSWTYLGVAAIGCLAVTKIKIIIDSHISPVETDNEGS